MHPRNRHRDGYDLPRLIAAHPPLAAFVRPTGHGHDSVDFADPAAVLALNRALLLADYGLAAWDLPPGYLCPPVPGRADYVHHLADLLAADHAGQSPRGDATVILDLGTGANAIYPLLGRALYGWRFVATEIDRAALASAERNLAATPALAAGFDLRRQTDATAVLRHIVRPSDRFAATMCNPPFHPSAAAAAAGTARKVRNLAAAPLASAHSRGPAAKPPTGRPAPSANPSASPAPPRNFAGRPHELWCPGGELAFIRRLIRESAEFPQAARWFTTLVSRRENLPPLLAALRAVRPTAVREIAMDQGQKRTRLLAWTFAPPA
jgi:23S rRNA (adenine1618-N6)-methyltransferase